MSPFTHQLYHFFTKNTTIIHYDSILSQIIYGATFVRKRKRQLNLFYKTTITFYGERKCFIQIS